MLKKRIIPCLDVRNGRTVKGVHFQNLVDAGDAVQLASHYSIAGADELVFLDISATEETRNPMVDFSALVAKNISIPFTMGGGIASLEQAKNVILSGADKIGINSAAVKTPDLIATIAEVLGSQAVVLAIDAKYTKNTKSGWEVYIAGGKIPTTIDLIDWVQKGQARGAGEILLTSIDCDGAKNGFDIPMLTAIEPYCSVPVIASGGAGTKEHFLELFQTTTATGALAASVFHFQQIDICALKEYLSAYHIPIRK